MHTSSRKRDTEMRCQSYQDTQNAASNKSIIPVLEEEEDENLGFVGAQYTNNTDERSPHKSPKIGSPHKKDSPNKQISPNKFDTPHKKKESPKKDSSHKKEAVDASPPPKQQDAQSQMKESPTTPKPKLDPKETPAVSTQATRKAEAKKKALDEYMRVAAEKKNKEQEDYLKHRAFLAEVEARRRANIVLNKAKKKRIAIFASQSKGMRKRFVAGECVTVVSHVTGVTDVTDVTGVTVTVTVITVWHIYDLLHNHSIVPSTPVQSSPVQYSTVQCIHTYTSVISSHIMSCHIISCHISHVLLPRCSLPPLTSASRLSPSPPLCSPLSALMSVFSVSLFCHFPPLSPTPSCPALPCQSGA